MAGGLVSSASDYHRFTRMLLNGGEDLLGTRTLAYMGRNHLPGGAELKQIARPTISETQNDGMGFGLGFSVVLDPPATKVLCAPGEIAWGGLASTAFFVDPGSREAWGSWRRPARSSSDGCSSWMRPACRAQRSGSSSSPLV